MITDQQIRQVIEDCFAQVPGQAIWRSYLIGDVLRAGMLSSQHINLVIDRGIADGWLLIRKQGIDMQLELASEPTTQRSPFGPIIKPTVPEIKLNTNDHTCTECQRKCNSSDKQCWWCETPIVKKGLFGL